VNSPLETQRLCWGFITHVTGPGVAQDSGHVGRGVGHDGVVVELFLGLVSVFKLEGRVRHGEYGVE